MTKIIEIAHMLGEEIAKSDEIKNLEAAKDAYERDAELQAKLAEYEAVRKLLGEEFSKSSDEADAKVIADLRAAIEDLSREIYKFPSYIVFANAKKAMDDLMNSVNSEIKYCITGERPAACTHDCSTCGGCSGAR